MLHQEAGIPDGKDLGKRGNASLLNSKDSPEKVYRAYTQKELAVLYRVAWKTMGRWLKSHEKAIGRKSGHFYSPKQVEVIFRVLGVPTGL